MPVDNPLPDHPSPEPSLQTLDESPDPRLESIDIFLLQIQQYASDEALLKSQQIQSQIAELSAEFVQLQHSTDTGSIFRRRHISEEVGLLERDLHFLRNYVTEYIEGSITSHEARYMVQIGTQFMFYTDAEDIDINGTFSQQMLEAIVTSSSQHHDKKVKNRLHNLVKKTTESASDPSLDQLFEMLNQTGPIISGNFIFVEEPEGPFHIVNKDAYITTINALKKTMDLFTCNACERKTALAELLAMQVQLRDFISIFPTYGFTFTPSPLDLPDLLISGPELNVLFELITNAAKYRRDKQQPIQLVVSHDEIKVINESEWPLQMAMKDLGTRGEAKSADGNGFGLARLPAIAGLADSEITYSSRVVEDVTEGNFFYNAVGIKKKAA